MKYEILGRTLVIKTNDGSHSFTAHCRDFEDLGLVESVLDFLKVKKIKTKPPAANTYFGCYFDSNTALKVKEKQKRTK